MRTAIFGGSFNPPHKGHTEAAQAAKQALGADRLLVIPGNIPPHKKEAEGSPSAIERLELTKIAFAKVPGAEVSDIEINRGGTSYTVDTLEELKKLYPEDELILLVGTDMLESFEKWKDFKRIFELVTLAVFPRMDGDKEELLKLKTSFEKEYGAKIQIIDFCPVEISSTELRELLGKRQGLEFVDDDVYAEIIKHRYYKSQPDFEWLRQKSFKCLNEKRIPHVRGCAAEAAKLARFWGADPELAEEAGILHDITKKLNAEEQLKLCHDYDIITDDDERANYKLLHSKTGAEYSRREFGICDEVYEAIKWHTTGKSDMTLLEKILYMADYMEPTRHFEGVEELRKLAYEDLDKAMILGLQMGIDELHEKGVEPHVNSINALKFFQK